MDSKTPVTKKMCVLTINCQTKRLCQTNSLGDYNWFAFLDQGKAYQQHFQVFQAIILLGCEYVGRPVSTDGMGVDLKDVEAEQALKEKTTQTVVYVRRLLCAYTHDSRVEQ